MKSIQGLSILTIIGERFMVITKTHVFSAVGFSCLWTCERYKG